MKRIILSALLCVFAMQCVLAQGKQPVSVLYVGGSPELDVVGGVEVDSATLARSAQARMASFAKFLKSRFRKVKVIDAKEYLPSMSDAYDVTVFDGRPRPIRPEVREFGNQFL